MNGDYGATTADKIRSVKLLMEKHPHTRREMRGHLLWLRILRALGR